MGEQFTGREFMLLQVFQMTFFCQVFWYSVLSFLCYLAHKQTHTHKHKPTNQPTNGHGWKEYYFINNKSCRLCDTVQYGRVSLTCVHHENKSRPLLRHPHVTISAGGSETASVCVCVCIEFMSPLFIITGLQPTGMNKTKPLPHRSHWHHKVQLQHW